MIGAVALLLGAPLAGEVLRAVSGCRFPARSSGFSCSTARSASGMTWRHS